MMNDPEYLIPGKLDPPHLPEDHVGRERCFHKRERFPTTRITLIEAPAGYGKTTLAAQWYHLLKSEGIRAGWVTLDTDDNDATDLARYLLKAISRGGVPFGDMTPAVGRGALEIPPRAALAVLLSRVHSFGRRFVLFLDDVHKINSPESLGLLESLVERAGDTCCIIAACRSRPAIGLARLGALNQLRVIGTDQLRFSLEEGRKFLGTRYSTEDADALILKTEGWPVALQLLKASTDLSDGPRSGLLAAVGDVDLSSYLAEQILAQLSEEDQRFLMLTSLPARISGDLANVLCGCNDGWERLERLERKDLLVLPVDNAHSWYRYHDLFREFLIQRITRKYGSRTAQFHKRIANWFAEQGDLSSAVAHCVEGGDYKLAVRLLERAGGWRLGFRRGMSVLRRLSDVPETIVRDFPLSRVALIYQLMQAGSVHEARSRFEELRRDTHNFKIWKHEVLDQRVRVECHILECLVLMYEDVALEPRFVEAVEAESDEVASLDPLLRILIKKNFKLYAYYDSGAYDKCIRVGMSAIQGLRRHGAVYALNYVNFYLGLAHYYKGEQEKAMEYYSKANEIAAHYFPDDFHNLIARIFISQVLYQRNQVNAARVRIEQSLADLPTNMDGWVPCFEAVYPTAARTRSLDGDLLGALAVLDEGSEFAAEMGFNRLLQRIEVQRIQELTRHGVLDGASEAAQRAGLEDLIEAGPESSVYSPQNLEEGTLALARLHLLEGRRAAASMLLEPLVRSTELAGHALSHLKSQVLTAAVWLRHERPAEGLQLLVRAVSNAESTSNLRVILDEQELLLPSVHEAATCSDDRLVARIGHFFDKHAAAPEVATASPSLAAPAALAGGLTPRERDVLDHLAEGLSSKEIAARLGVAESTIKSYRKTLYQKLEARRRSQVIARAREMALIP